MASICGLIKVSRLLVLLLKRNEICFLNVLYGLYQHGRPVTFLIFKSLILRTVILVAFSFRDE